MARTPRLPRVLAFPRVLEHTDWRVFLRAWLQACRRAFGRRNVSGFAETAGCSDGHVTNALKRRRLLQGSLVDGFGRAAGLLGPFLDYWRLMVFLSEEAPPSLRPQILAEMAGIRASIGNYPAPTTETILALRAVIQPMEGTPVERHLARWIQPVVLALAACPDFRTDLHEIVAALGRRATVTGVRQALAELVALGLLAEGPDGGLRPTGAVLATYGPMPPATYQLHHAQDLDVAVRQLYAMTSDTTFILDRDGAAPGALSAHMDAVVELVSEVGALAETIVGAGWCSLAVPGPPDGAPCPDRVLEVAIALVPTTLQAPTPRQPAPSPLVRRGRGRPPKPRPA